MPDVTIAKIAVSGIPFRLDRPFDYAIPLDMKEKVQPGVRVEVPFTRANRRTEGIVLALAPIGAYEKLKPISEVLDETPILTQAQIKLALWMHERFFCTVHEAVRAMLPAGLYGVLAAALKVKFGTNETLLTLMLNYVALYFITFLGETKAAWNFFLEPSSARPIFTSFSSLAEFPAIPIGKFHLNVCVILAILIGVGVYFYLKYTKHGYEIAVVGDSIGTARYAGMKVNRIILRTVFLSACLIGLAAAFKVGTAGILSTAITDDVGWTGIIVAWLAKLNTGVIFLVSALIGVLQYGSAAAAATFAQVDSSFADMLQGAILFLVLAADFFTRFRVVPSAKGGNSNGNG